MTLENIYYIGQTVAVIAIIVTLLLLILQGRQTQRQIEQANVIAAAQLSKSSTEYFFDLLAGFRKSPEENAFMDKALFTMDPLSDYEQSLLDMRLSAIFASAVVSHEMWQKGMMSEDTYTAGIGIMVGLLTWPRPRKYWNVYQTLYNLNPAVIDEFNMIMERAKTLPQIMPRDHYDLNNALPEDMPV